MTIRSIFGKLGNERGSIAEDKAYSSLGKFTKPTWLLSYRKATKEEDSDGIDLILETDVGKIFLQIKSSEHGVKLFKNKKRRKLIIPIVIQMHEDDQFVFNKVIQAGAEARKTILGLRK